MENGYDENLTENPFFIKLKDDFEDIFLEAVSENWTICVPCIESLNDYEVTQESICCHILIPSDELPELQFHTLSGEDVKIYNNTVRVRNYSSIPVLFSEVFYVDEARYKVICVERPLNSSCHSNTFNCRLHPVKSLHECVALLNNECSNKLIINRIDEIIKQYLFLSTKNFFTNNTEQQVQFMKDIQRRCYQLVANDVELQSRARNSRMLTENVQVSIESYVLHNMYPIIMKGLITNMTCEIGEFNKTLRSLSNIQLRHLKVSETLFDSILKARAEISRFHEYSTVLAKLRCLKQCINLLSNQKCSQLSVDELLPILVFVVVKSGIATWPAQLKFVQEFGTTSVKSDFNYGCESNFLITTLEAILTFIRSGSFYQTIYSSEMNNGINVAPPPSEATDICTYVCSRSKMYWKTKQRPRLLNVFHHIYNDDLNAVENEFTSPEALSEEQNGGVCIEYCHPLCSCDKCEKIFSANEQAAAPSSASFNLNTANESGYTALHVASCYGKCSIVDWLLNNGARPNCADFYGSTPVHCAALHGYQNIVLLLVYKLAVLDPTDDDGNTPLHLASVNGHLDCVKALLYFAEQANVRLDVNAANKDGDTALHLATKYYHKEICEILLSYNANPSAKNRHGSSAFEMSESLLIKGILNEKYDSVNLLLVQQASTSGFSAPVFDKATIDKCRLSKGDFGVRPTNADDVRRLNNVFKVVRRNDAKTLKSYFGFGGHEGATAELATTLESLSKCHPLCKCEKCHASGGEKGDDDDLDLSGSFSKVNAALSVNICDADGFAALHIAAKYGRTEIVQFLLDVGALIDVRTYKQLLTPLHIACIQNYLTVVKVLLQRRGVANVNAQDRNGNTALHYACMASNIRIVEWMLQYEPDLEIRNDRGKTCINEAEESLSYSVMKLLQEAKAIARKSRTVDDEQSF